MFVKPGFACSICLCGPQRPTTPKKQTTKKIISSSSSCSLFCPTFPTTSHLLCCAWGKSKGQSSLNFSHTANTWRDGCIGRCPSFWNTCSVFNFVLFLYLMRYVDIMTSFISMTWPRMAAAYNIVKNNGLKKTITRETLKYKHANNYE